LETAIAGYFGAKPACRPERLARHQFNVIVLRQGIDGALNRPNGASDLLGNPATIDRRRLPGAAHLLPK
jgi:hypothetical protein